MKKSKFDITKQELGVADENFYFDQKINAFTAVYEYNFNPDEYFGTLSYDPHDEPDLSFGTDWHMDTDDIIMLYWGNFKDSNGNVELEKKLTKQEKKFFKELMDQFCVEKYGVSIFNLHRPLTEDECATFACTSEEETEWDQTNEEKNEWGEEDEEDQETDDDEMEYEVQIEMCIHLPGTDVLDEQTVMANIHAAFNAAGVSDLIDDMASIIDDPFIRLGFTMSVMHDDNIDAENFCMDTLKPVKEELRIFGYQVTDIACNVTEV